MTTANRLELRLQRIEARLRELESIVLPEPPRAAPPEEAPRQSSQEVARPASPPAPPKQVPTAPPISRPVQPTPPPVIAKPAPAPPRRAAAPKPKRPTWSWEQLVGGKLFAALGALVVVTGLALFLKLAYDYGWLNQISGAGKCLIGASFGIALLVAGELARRKWNALASAGLTAAGIGAMYASAYSAFRFYELLSPPVAFGLLVAISLLGVVVAVRARLVSVAVLSILAAYLTPILMASANSPAYILPAYLQALTAQGLVLSAMHARFRVLRSLVWWGTAILGGLWVLTRAGDAPTIAVVFCALTWFAFHAELLWSARHGGMRGKRRAHDAARPLVVSLGTTSWSVLLAAFALHRAGSPDLWLAPGVAMVIAILSSTILSGHLRVLRDVPENDEERLGAVLLAQAGALLIATIAMGVTTEWLQVACWLVFGVASIFAGRWVGSRSLDVYGVIVLSLGLGRLLLLDSWIGPMRAGGHEVWGLVLTEWTLMMVIAGACWIVAGRLLLIRVGTHKALMRGFGITCAAIGWAAIIGSAAHEHAEPEALAVAWGLLAFPMLGVHRLERRLAIDIMALAPLLLGVIAWLNAYVLAGWEATAGDIALHPGLLVALLLIAIGCGLTWWYARAYPKGEGGASTLGVSVFALFIAATSLELVRHVGIQLDVRAAEPDALALWWTLCAIAGGVWGVVRRRAYLQIGALVLLVIAGLAWFLGYPGESWAQTNRGLLVHPGVVSGLALGAMLTLFAAWSRGRGGVDRVVVWTPVLTGVVLFLSSTSLEVVRHVGILIGETAAQADALSVWWAVCALAGGAWGIIRRRRSVLVVPTILALIAGATWFVGFPLSAWDATSRGLAIHPGVVSSLVGAGVLAALSIGVRRRGGGLSPWAWIPLTLGVLLVFASSSLELSRHVVAWTDDTAARAGAVSIWWGLFAIALLLWGGLGRVPGIRWSGLGLLGVATGKALIYDLADVDPAWRVASFLALGLLLLGVGAGYLRRIGRAQAEPAEDGDEEASP